MQLVKWTPDELLEIEARGEVSIATARAAMMRSRINFDQIEDINGHYEAHTWGSDADRRYRDRAVKRAVATVAAHPMEYSVTITA